MRVRNELTQYQVSINYTARQLEKVTVLWYYALAADSRRPSGERRPRRVESV